MKKQILAASVAAALALPAMAQPTLYGRIDTAARSTDGEFSTVSGSFLTSVIGLKSTEDIGSGFKAHVWLEGSMDAYSGSVGRSDRGLFNREASLTLETPAGSLTFGRTDASDTSGFDAWTGIQNIGNFSFFPFLAGSWTRDRSNVIRYASPRMAGLQLQVGHVEASNDGPETDTASVNYRSGPLAVYIGADDAAIGEYKGAGARYDFGFAAVGAAYAELTGPTNLKSQSYTTKVPLPGNFSAMGSYRITDTNGTETKSLTAGLSKNLSKRTQLLAFYQNNTGTNKDFFQVGLLHTF